MKNLLKVGDVFKSKKFAELCHVYIPHRDRKPGRSKNKLTFASFHMLTGSYITKKPGGYSKRVRYSKDSRVSPGMADKLMTAEWVVTEAVSAGGSKGGGMSGHDYYPDGWRITAVMLDEEGEFFSQNYTVTFYQSGSFQNMLEPKHVKLTGRMKMTFVREETF